MSDTVVFVDEQTPAEKPAAPVEQVPAERPAWLPENFKTVEDFVKSSQDTRAELTRVQQELAKAKPQAPAEEPKPADGEPPKAEEKPEEQNALEIPENAEIPTDVDISDLQQEYLSTGDLSEEGRTEAVNRLLKHLPPETARRIVDDYVESAKIRDAALKDRAENQEKTLRASVGGDEAYSSMMQWAAQSLSAADKKAFNNSIASGDFATQQLAVEGLKSKWQGAVGKNPRLINGHGGGGDAVMPFRSIAELTAAQKDPRYRTDETYRDHVVARLGASNF